MIKSSVLALLGVLGIAISTASLATPPAAERDIRPETPRIMRDKLFAAPFCREIGDKKSKDGARIPECRWHISPKDKARMQSLFSQMLEIHPCWPKGRLPNKAREQFRFGPELPQALANCFADTLQGIPKAPTHRWEDRGQRRGDATRKPSAPYGYRYAPPIQRPVTRQKPVPISI